MKRSKMMKRFAAVFTAAAVMGSFGTAAVFAENEVSLGEPSVYVEDTNIFKVVLPYEGVPEDGQTTWMAYRADSVETPLGDLAIEYINQDATAKTVTLYVRSVSDEITEETILQEPDLLVKVGGTDSVPMARVIHLSEIDMNPGIAGDVNENGEIDPQDGQVLLRGISGTVELTETQIKLGDVNGNGEIDPNDGQQLLKKISDPNYEFVAM